MIMGLPCDDLAPDDDKAAAATMHLASSMGPGLRWLDSAMLDC